VAMDWMLQAAARALVIERKRESWHGVVEIEIEAAHHWNQPYSHPLKGLLYKRQAETKDLLLV
jgi:hypothetical protein